MSKVLVITGSAHKNGTTAYLAERLIEGAAEKGHQIYRFDAAFREVHPCLGCDHCRSQDGGCVFKDDMEELNPHLLEADVIALVSPIYYYGMSAQIKAVIDRFYANDERLHGGKKACLIVAMEDDAEESAAGALASFRGMTNYLDWEAAGSVVGVSCGTPEALKKTEYPQRAYELGRSL